MVVGGESDAVLGLGAASTIHDVLHGDTHEDGLCFRMEHVDIATKKARDAEKAFECCFGRRLSTFGNISVDFDSAAWGIDLAGAVVDNMAECMCAREVLGWASFLLF